MIEKIEFDSKKFPPLLKEIPHPPKLIYTKGVPLSQAPHVAIVGTRKASLEGKRIAKEFATEFGKNGIVVVSGLAMGIDTAAHEGALLSNGSTVAVLVTGLEKIYPRQNHNLAEKIVKSGTLVSEYPEGTPSFPSQFLERNRIISGLSLGIVVIEAPQRSGALSTARFALEQDREVFVVPGPARSENYSGSHKLIRQGAELVTKADDIIESLNIDTDELSQQKLFRDGVDPIRDRGRESRSTSNGVDNKKKDGVAYSGMASAELEILKILKAIGKPATIDEICLAGKLDSTATSRSVSILVIKNLVKEESGKYYI
jgi:DNA processing protein